MRALADYVVRGQKQAIIAAVIAGCLPLLTWVGAAIVALVTLRKDWQIAVPVFLWGLLPGIAWWLVGDPSTLLVLIMTWLAAIVLRHTVSLLKSVTVVAALGIGLLLLIQWLAPEWMAQLHLLEQQVIQRLNVKWPGVEQQDLLELVSQMVLAMAALGIVVTSLSALFVGRWWQAQLFNPGGFQQEFHHLKLSPLFSLVLIALIGLGIYIKGIGWAIIPLLLVPITLAGFALVHAIVKIKQAGTTGLLIFYVTFLLTLPYGSYLLLIAAVLLDSKLDFRSRLENPDVN